MKKLLMPVWLIGWYLLTLSVLGFTAHYYLLSYPHYGPFAQVTILILSTLNLLFGLVFIFLRRILILVIRLLLFLFVRNMNRVFSEALYKLSQELGRVDIRTP